MPIKIEPSWEKILAGQFSKPYFIKLADFIRSEYQVHKVYPPPKEIFSAFDMCPFEKVKVVILGQDPYHDARQANGLAFSVQSEMALPPSLRNIFKEIQNDLGRPISENGDLSRWATQGVLLLNATLTVSAHSPGSHQNKGWEEFTDAVIKSLSQKRQNLVFLLWGSYARKKGEIIDRTKHLVLEAPHPSPFSADRGFFGCRHFSQANDFLVKYKIKPIDW